MIIDKLVSLQDWSLVDESDESLYVSYFHKSKQDHSYENNWAFVQQETRNGGAKYQDGEILLTVVSKHPDSPYIFMFPPLGSFDVFLDKVEDVIWQIISSTNKCVVLRKLTRNQVDKLLTNPRFKNIDHTTFTYLRDVPEDIYPQVIIDVKKSFSCHGSRFVKIRNHVAHFTRENQPKIIDLNNDNAKDLNILINKWLDQFNKRHSAMSNVLSEPIVDITAYTCLAENFASKIDNVDYFSKLMYLHNQPLGFILSGRTSSNDAALYSSICVTGYRGASEYLLIQLLAELMATKINCLNMGGAESESLFNFKSKFAVHQLQATFDLLYDYSDFE